MCLLGSVNVGASDAGATIWTAGSEEAQVTPLTVWTVGLRAASYSVNVRLDGAAPGQVRLTQVEVLIAAIATHEGVAEEPRVTQRLFWPLPSEPARLAASLEAVWAQALIVPPTTNCPVVGLFTARTGGVVSTVKLLFVEVPVIPSLLTQVAITSYVPSGTSVNPKLALPPETVAVGVPSTGVPGATALSTARVTVWPSSALVLTTNVAW